MLNLWESNGMERRSLKSRNTHEKVKAQLRVKDGGRGCACTCDLRRILIYMVGPSVSHTHWHPQQALYVKKSTNSFYVFSTHRSEYVLCTHALCHYIKRFLPPCCQSFLHGFPLILDRQGQRQELYARLMVPIGRQRLRSETKKTLQFVQPWKRQARPQAHQWTASSNNKSEMGLHCQFFSPQHVSQVQRAIDPSPEQQLCHHG